LRAAERARHIVEVVELASVAADQVAQDIGALVRVRAAGRGEIGIEVALEASLGVPRGLAVAHVVEERFRHRFGGRSPIP
jgi:hypothetical protein